MSLDNEAVVDDSTDLESNLEQASEVVASEQSELEDSQGVAAEGNETKQAGETEDDFNLGDVLTGKAEPDEKEPNKMPRSTARALRKNKRKDKEIASLQKQVSQLQDQQAPNVQVKVPERDWDNETDEQFSFRQMQAVMGHQQSANHAANQHNQQVKQAVDNVSESSKIIDTYSDEVDKLNLPKYDESESRILEMMPEGSLIYMSKIDPAATAKIIYHLDHNPEKAAYFADLSHNDAAGFNYEFGKLSSQINELESKGRKKHKAISKAKGDTSLESSGHVGNSIKAKMDAAADRGDHKLYMALEAQQK